MGSVANLARGAIGTNESAEASTEESAWPKAWVPTSGSGGRLLLAWRRVGLPYAPFGRCRYDPWCGTIPAVPRDVPVARRTRVLPHPAGLWDTPSRPEPSVPSPRNGRGRSRRAHLIVAREDGRDLVGMGAGLCAAVALHHVPVHGLLADLSKGAHRAGHRRHRRPLAVADRRLPSRQAGVALRARPAGRRLSGRSPSPHSEGATAPCVRGGVRCRLRGGGDGVKCTRVGANG